MSDLLSKSTFIRSLQCQKSLYLYKRHYNLRDEISFEQQAIFDRGHKVGILAQELFPDGVDAGWESPVQYKKSTELTRKLIESGTNVIYEAAFVWNDVLVAVDILVKEESGWHIYEVKSSLSISETYIRDTALQYYIIGKSGLNITGVSIIHLNKNYLFNGDLELDKLFVINNITDIAFQTINEVIPGLIRARKTLMLNSVPDINIGPHCTDPYPCDFMIYCRKNLIPKDSIFELTELEEGRKWELFENNMIRLKDIPMDYPLNEPQKIEVDCLIEGKVHIDPEKIGKMIQSIVSPAAFLDIQVFRPAVPVVRQAHPYKQIPFGYSILSVDTGAADLMLTQYLAKPDPDFEEEWLRRYVEDTAPYQTIIVFDKKWELWALKNCASRFPEWVEPVNACIEKMVDLSEIFSNKYFYHPVMQKGYSIRALPAVFGIDSGMEQGKIGSDSHAGTAFEYLFNEQDLFGREEIKDMIMQYMKANVVSINLVYKALSDVL